MTKFLYILDHITLLFRYVGGNADPQVKCRYCITNWHITDFNKRFDYFANHLSKDGVCYCFVTHVTVRLHMVANHCLCRMPIYPRVGERTEARLAIVLYWFLMQCFFSFLSPDIQLFTCFAWCQEIYAIWTHLVSGSDSLCGKTIK